MSDADDRPVCFADLDTVFPMRPDGLRATPTQCLCCVHKTACLRAAMARSGGVGVRQEMVDRAYQSGVMGFFERWSKKKALDRQSKTKPT